MFIKKFSNLILSCCRMREDIDLDQKQKSQRSQLDIENKEGILNQQQNFYRITDLQKSFESCISIQSQTTILTPANQKKAIYERKSNGSIKKAEEIESDKFEIKKQSYKKSKLSKQQSKSISEIQQFPQNEEQYKKRTSINNQGKRKVNFQIDKKIDHKQRLRNYTIKVLKKQLEICQNQQSLNSSEKAQQSALEEDIQKITDTKIKIKRKKTAYEKYKDQIEAQNKMEQLKLKDCEKNQSCFNKPKKRDS